MQPDFFFESDSFFQLTFIGQHVQEQIELIGFVHMALAVKGSFIRIEATGNVLCEYSGNVCFQLFGFCECSKGMQISYHEIAGILILHANIIAQCAKIIAEVKKSCWPDAAHYDRFDLLLFS